MNLEQEWKWTPKNFGINVKQKHLSWKITTDYYLMEFTNGFQLNTEEE